MPRTGTLSLLALGAVLALAVAAPAFAAKPVPRWKSSVVTYRDKSKSSLDRGAVRIAIAWWNATPGNFTFRKASGGAPADITVRSVNTAGVDYDGLATWSTDRSGTYFTVARLDLNDFYLAREDPEYVAEVAAHEIGHALGLPHLRDDCSLMYPSGSVATRCPRDAGPQSPGSGRFFCGPQISDVKGLIARYGGSLGTWPGTVCAGTAPSARAASFVRHL